MREEVWSSVARGGLLLFGNARAARWAAEEYGRGQARDGRRSWATPAIYSLEAWLEREWNRWGDIPTLTPEQELLVWEEAIAADGAGAAAARAAAPLAAPAWERTVVWRLPERGSAWQESADTAAFRGWADRVRARAAREGWITAAERGDRIAAALRQRPERLPREVWLAGFDAPTPQQEALAEALRATGAAVEWLAPERPAGVLRVCAAPDAGEELAWAARWAFSHRGSAGPTGVIVPDLAARRAEVEAVFLRVFHPERAPWSGEARGFHLSLGSPLARQPLAEAALELLECAAGGEALPAEAAYRLLRSPWLGRAERDFGARARAEAELRRHQHERVEREALRRAGLRVPRLPKGKPACHADWAVEFGAALEAAGWPGERALDSAEYQAVEALRAALAEFAGLDAVAAPPRGGEDALRRLQGITARRVFQARAQPAPVQVLGWLEAAGLEFERLWVCGLHDQALPAPPAPHPFLPGVWQRERGLPHATAAQEAAFAERTLERLRRSTAELVASWPRKQRDVELRPSPLLQAAEAWTAGFEAPAAARPPDVEELADARAPALSEAERAVLRGGSDILKAQSICPFRGFAAHRLHTAPLPEAPTGLTAPARGKLLHEMLCAVWTDLRTREALRRASEAELREKLVRAAAAAVAAEPRLADRPEMAAVVREWLAWQAGKWLEVEKQRSEAFTVADHEIEHTAAIGGLELHLRLDRVDELERGGRLLVDYKSGVVTSEPWDFPRPWEPQLPLYLVTDPASEDYAGIAFAQLKPGDMRFRAAQRREGVVDADPTPGWKREVAQWRHDLEALAHNFAAGEAAVDPKPPRRQSCEFCGLQPLCRVEDSDLAERAALIAESGEDGDGD